MTAETHGSKMAGGNARLKNGRRECTAVKIAAGIYGSKNGRGNIRL